MVQLLDPTSVFMIMITINPTGGFISSPVHIGTNVWIGANVVILKGVTVGDGAVIGAGTVIAQDVECNATVVGSKNRRIR